MRKIPSFGKHRVDGAALLERLRLELGRTPPHPVAYVPGRRKPAAQRLAEIVLRAPFHWLKSVFLLHSSRRKIRQLERSLASLTGTLTTLEAAFQLRLQDLSQATEMLRTASVGQRKDITALGKRVGKLEPGSSHHLDALYFSFEEAFRGSQEDIKERLSKHLPRILQAEVGEQERPILDLGCGRGEWLQILKEQGLVARGVDLNSYNVKLCQTLRLDVKQTDALSALRHAPDESLGGVTGFHFAEHLPFEILVNIIDESLRALTKGGIILLETPNPENLMVSSRNFYFDPTHKHPIPPQVLAFLVERRGFRDVEIIRLHPYERKYHLDASLGPAEALFNEWFFGPQDYAIFARKPTQ